MVKPQAAKKNPLIAGVCCAVLAGVAGLIACISHLQTQEPLRLSLTPWACIGGCGAGGSGGAGSGIVKWVGRGVSGGLLDVQVLSNLEIGQTRRNIAVTPRMTFKPDPASSLSLTVPVLSKESLFQPQANLAPQTMVTGGIGDVMLDYSKSFGMSGQYSVMTTLVLPTGQYDIVRGAETSPQVLSNMLQLGGGVYTASIGMGYNLDFDKGILLFDCMYLHPFAVNFSGRNTRNDASTGGWGYDTGLMDENGKRRFAYHFKPYGENDLGGYFPPSVFAAIYYGDKRSREYVSSYGFSMSVPLGVTWIPGFAANLYDPVPDPDFQAWSGTLQYGLELCDERRPMYIVVSKLVHDRTNPPSQTERYHPGAVNRWNGPDWKDFACTWSFTVGIRTSLFQ